MESTRLLSIKVISDFNCPWCEVGRNRLDAALSELPDTVTINIRWIPYFLYDMPEAGLPWTEHMKRRWGSSNPSWYSSMEMEVKSEGIDIMNHSPHMANTTDAHRVCEFAFEKLGWKKHEQLHTNLIKGYYSEKMNIQDREVLVRESAKVGLNEDEVRSFLNDEINRQQFIRETKLNQKHLGIGGVPHFVFNETEQFHGAGSPKQLLQVITKALSS